ncbi:MAG: acyl-CoA thioesterase [Bacteroidetes Order II. Incertae sedis bacterium]|jgi:acyl-CoA hydrolase|nr:acyl-CoA thioesterase [Bacteroidetes Order II. bacterium]MDG1755096.1 acyl-CoA thioesterase [Rhodothermales bacterium]HAY37055.1 acyl-CoA thioesterase [Bacteroidota bacterium]MBT4601888.1 acyl-CoA thioesterase [Bacteroidetes Order II. bacterium]MBT5249626.1 acyl-CoA thioesterase [Bacteroidetes Order II. bacterium]
MDRLTRTASHSYSIMSELVLPNDTNGLGNLMGGRLLHWMDICAAISSQRHAGSVCVTASVDNVEFHHPILQSDIVILESRVNRAFNSSMEIEITVDAENPRTGTKKRCNQAFYTFVAVDSDGKPKQIPELVPETAEEIERFNSAQLRRDFRLFLAGRLNAERVENIEDFLKSVKDAHSL